MITLDCIENREIEQLAQINIFLKALDAAKDEKRNQFLAYLARNKHNDSCPKIFKLLRLFRKTQATNNTK